VTLLVAGAQWDVVIVDHIGAAGLADGLDTLFPPGLPPGHSRPTLIYLSRNHETSVRALTAAEFLGNPVKNWPCGAKRRRSPGLKRGWWNRRISLPLIRNKMPRFSAPTTPAARRLSSNRDMAARLWRRARLTTTRQRRATIVGSFGWIAKQMNLEAFLGVTAPKFAAAGAEIEILGTIPDTYKAKIERAYPSMLVRGQYEDVAPYIAATRLGIVPEQTGGEFKHKDLSYAFCRVPVAAIEGSVAGMPIMADENILYAPDMNALADTCLAALEGFGRLNRLQDTAFRAVETSFD